MMFRNATFVASQGLRVQAFWDCGRNASWSISTKHRSDLIDASSKCSSLLEDLLYHAKDIRESRTMTL